MQHQNNKISNAIDAKLPTKTTTKFLVPVDQRFPSLTVGREAVKKAKILFPTGSSCEPLFSKTPQMRSSVPSQFTLLVYFLFDSCDRYINKLGLPACPFPHKYVVESLMLGHCCCRTMKSASAQLAEDCKHVFAVVKFL